MLGTHVMLREARLGRAGLAAPNSAQTCVSTRAQAAPLHGLHMRTASAQCHCMAGGSAEGYCKLICAAAAAKGWRAVVLNYRGCAGARPVMCGSCPAYMQPHQATAWLCSGAAAQWVVALLVIQA